MDWPGNASIKGACAFDFPAPQTVQRISENEYEVRPDISHPELEREMDLLIFEEKERRSALRGEVECEVEEIVLAVLGTDNRNFIKMRIGGKYYRALLDPGATVSLVGPVIAARFDGELSESSSRVRTATGTVSRALGNLSLMVEIDGRSEKFVFRAVAELDQEVILGMEFCRRFDIDVRLGRDLWRAGEGEWHSFDREGPVDPVDEVIAECAAIVEIQPDERERVYELVEKILSRQGNGSGATSLIEHRIRVTDDIPIKHKFRRMSPVMLDTARQIVQQWSEDGIIEPSTSDYSSAPVLVKKHDGSYRMCIDYRDLNAKTVKDAYPAPSLDSILDGLCGAKYISKIDLKSAFLQVPVEENSKRYTAFAVPGSGLWQFRRMPFGLTNSPATFCRLIDSLFGPRDQPHVFAYLDDAIVVTETFEEHLKWLEYVLNKLVDAGLVVNKEKCEFCCSRITYLGYLLDSEGLRPDPDRIAPLVNYPAPKNIKQLRRFLGMIGYYARFLKRDSEMKVPLTRLLRKGQEWEWGEEQQEAFEALKKALTVAPVLARPDFSRPFTIQCDASGQVIGAVLTQMDDDEEEHPIVYISRMLTTAERNYTVTELECLACLWSIKKLRAYVEGYKFTVITDHSALLWLKNLKDPTGRLARWALEMQQWDFDIVHRKGTLHSVPDALSRMYEDVDVEKVACFSEDVVRRDSWYTRMLLNVTKFPKKYPTWRIVDGLLYKYHYSALLDPILYREESWKLVVPEELRERVMQEAHSSPSTGHFGVEKTFDRIA